MSYLSVQNGEGVARCYLFMREIVTRRFARGVQLIWWILGTAVECPNKSNWFQFDQWYMMTYTLTKENTIVTDDITGETSEIFRSNDT